MAFLDQEYNVDDLPVGGDYDLIPAGWYQAMIQGADVCATKTGSGQYIKLKLSIIAPTHQGRVVFANLNIKNASAAAEDIGRKQLGDVLRAIGVHGLRDTEQLINGNLMIKMAIKEAQNGYDAQNEVKGYKAVEGIAQSMPKAAQPAAQETGKTTPPWAKK